MELHEAMSVAKMANLAKSEFLSSMSHELRTPLNAILGFAQLIEGAARRDALAKARRADSQGRLVPAGLDQRRPRSPVDRVGQAVAVTRTRVAGRVMLECQTMIEPQAQGRGIRVSFPRLETPHFVKADRTRVKQVLINLLSNAIKYNNAGGTVLVSCVVNTPGHVRIAVEDTGEGLSPADIAQLFQPFNRLGRAATEEEGTGIGLVVCKRLVELMGGVIGAESTAGKGSVFWFELDLTTKPQPSDIASTAMAIALEQDSARTRLRTLLYVEDNPANLMLVEDLVARRADIHLLTAGPTPAVASRLPAPRCRMSS